jgi:hypothetical protein
MARVIMGQSMSNCSECKGNADPSDKFHIKGGPLSGWSKGSSLNDNNGCGVEFNEPPLNPYFDYEEFLRAQHG